MRSQATVFLSYSRRDSDAVRSIARELADRGRRVWVDWADIPPTASWKTELEEAIARSEAVVLLITPSAMASTEVHAEIELALRFEKKIVPILLEKVDPQALPEHVRTIQWIDFLQDRERALEQVIGALDTDLPWVREHTRLLERAREWDNKGRERGLLLRGRDLQRAEGWFAGSSRKEPRPSPLHAAFITTSRRAASATQRTLIASVTGALVVMTVLAIVAVLQSRQRERQRQIAVAKQMGTQAVLAREQRGAGLTVSALLAAESTRRLLELGDTSVEGAQALVSALQLLPRRVLWLPHSEVLWDVDLSSSGDWLVTAGGRTARVYRVPSDAVHVEVENAFLLSEVHIDDSARYLLCTPRDRKQGIYALWDLATKTRVPVPASGMRPTFAAMSPTGRLYAISDGVTIEAYTPSPPRLVRSLEVEGDLAAIRILEDDTLQIDSAAEVEPAKPGEKRSLRIVRDEYPAESLPSSDDRSTGGDQHAHRHFEATAVLPDRLIDFRLDPNRRTLITSSESISQSSLQRPTTLTLWETSEGRRRPGENSAPSKPSFESSYSLTFDRGVTDLEFSPDGLRFATASGDFRMQVWESLSGREAQRVEHAGTGRAVAFARMRGDGNADRAELELWATAASDRFVGLWARTVSRIDRRDERRPRQVTRGMSLSPDGGVLAVSTTTAFELWNVETGTLIVRESLRNAVEGASGVPVFHPHPRTPVFVGTDRLVVPGREATVIYSRDGRLLDDVKYDRAQAVALAPAGDFVAVASANAVRLMRLPAGEAVTEFMQGGVRDLAVDVNGRYVAAAGTSRLVLWDVRETRAVPIDPPENARVVAFSPDGRWLVAGGGDTVRVYDLTSPQVAVREVRRRPVRSGLAEGEGQQNVAAISFSSDSRIAAVVWGEGWLTLWALGVTEPLFDEQSDGISALAFSPDGSTLAASSRNAPVRLWDGLTTGIPREILRIPHRENVHSLAFRQDGSLLASASSDDTILLSPVKLNDLLEEAVGRLPRNLTPPEWTFYLGAEPYRCTVPSLSDCATHRQVLDPP